jgi:hypothetical protein
VTSASFLTDLEARFLPPSLGPIVPWPELVTRRTKPRRRRHTLDRKEPFMMLSTITSNNDV